jgi:D-3-phosphoglycerate dehydrogenase
VNVRIDDFKLTMKPEGHLAYIRCSNKAGTGASITALLADKKININRMNLGDSEDRDMSNVLLATDTTIPGDVLKEIEASPLVESIALMEL